MPAPDTGALVTPACASLSPATYLITPSPHGAEKNRVRIARVYSVWRKLKVFTEEDINFQAKASWDSNVLQGQLAADNLCGSSSVQSPRGRWKGCKQPQKASAR